MCKVPQKLMGLMCKVPSIEAETLLRVRFPFTYLGKFLAVLH
jgi:hypothetical protein